LRWQRFIACRSNIFETTILLRYKSEIYNYNPVPIAPNQVLQAAGTCAIWMAIQRFFAHSSYLKHLYKIAALADLQSFRAKAAIVIFLTNDGV
jgi:hypothetical protein